IELGDLGLEEGVACFLGLDVTAVDRMHAEPDEGTEHDHRRGDDVELLPALAALLDAVREKVDPDHASNLLNARPQAAISEGASESRGLGRTLLLSVMPAKGLAMTVSTWARAPTTSPRPGMAAHPPASTM